MHELPTGHAERPRVDDINQNLISRSVFQLPSENQEDNDGVLIAYKCLFDIQGYH